jgi:C1A family cysteine protease
MNLIRMRIFATSGFVIVLCGMLSAAVAQTPPLAQWAATPPRNEGLPGMGLVPSPESAFASSASIQIAPAKAGSLPRRVINSRYLPPVRSQEQQGSCVAWSTAYYCYGYHIGAQLDLSARQLADDHYEFSPAFIYHLRRDLSTDAGMQISESATLLRTRGCATFADMPYDPEDSKTPPSTASAEHGQLFIAREAAALFRGSIVGSKIDIESAKTYLAVSERPFVIGIPIFTDFPAVGQTLAEGYVYRPTIDINNPQNFRGLHAITIVGYDDALHAFLMVNSWGQKWGQDGFLWLSEDFIHSLGFDAWTFVSGGPRAKDHATDTRQSAYGGSWKVIPARVHPRK